jgi:hypothetical protein
MYRDEPAEESLQGLKKRVCGFQKADEALRLRMGICAQSCACKVDRPGDFRDKKSTDPGLPDTRSLNLVPSLFHVTRTESSAGLKPTVKVLADDGVTSLQ